MSRKDKNPTYPVSRTVYLSRETDEILTKIAGLLGVQWTALARAVFDEYANRTQEAGQNFVLRALNTDLTKKEGRQ